MNYSLKDLQKEYLKGKRYQFLFFWGHTPPADGVINQNCLSQWWMQDFEITGVTYSCAEQYMMAEKARLFRDEEMLEQIIKAGHPKKMKACGRAVRNFDSSLWEANCYRIVKTASLAKFSQNPKLLEFLLGTSGRILVEASPRDRIWGIGMGKTNPDAENPLKWKGTNLLGFALSETRDELIEKRDEST